MNNTLTLQEQTILSQMPDTAQIVTDPTGVGVFLKFTAEKPACEHVFSLGPAVGVKRFTGAHRYEPFWMKPQTGTRLGQVAQETQYLLTEREDGTCVLLVPLLDGAFRASLQGAGEDGLALVIESGDPATVGTEFVGLFVAAGRDPYTLFEQAAPAVMARMGTGRLRREKSLPGFVDQFGWCTWDAFYQDVSLEKVREGLESFAAGGLTPKLLILDDGWQSVEKKPSGEQRLTAFEANEKFPGDLAPTVTMAKSEFGIETFLVWHAMTGYWGGVDGDTLPGYGVRPTRRNFSQGILNSSGSFNDHWWGPIVGLVPPDHAYRFFQDYHRHLRAQGVDGVKVDTQATLEGVAAGLGGRVTLMHRTHEALEGSVQTQFAGNLINCMSCSNDMLYGALNSTVTRTSTDFWPDLPASHGEHLYTNAQVSAWFGEFVHPDWDMFQSGHPMGGFHAAGRAVSGGPVYVSDKPAAHDFALLRKLVLPDGSVLRAQEPGRPTRDCLFHDPTKEDVLLKIFSRNRGSGVVGVFNARYAEGDFESLRLTGTVGPLDVEGLAGDRFVVYGHGEGTTQVLGREETHAVSLPSLGYDVFTLIPIDGGMAPIGLADMFNSAGAIMAQGFSGSEAYEMTVRGEGRFLIWTERTPSQVALDGDALDFAYDGGTFLLTFTLPNTGGGRLRIGLG